MPEAWGVAPDALTAILGSSRFRSSFHLTDRDRAIIARRGWETVEKEARELIAARLAPAHPVHDGRQTPWRGHVVFVAQHATGCCCRGCLARIHHIPAGEALSAEQFEYVIAVLLRWLHREAGNLKIIPPQTVQPELF